LAPEDDRVHLKRIHGIGRIKIDKADFVA